MPGAVQQPAWQRALTRAWLHRGALAWLLMPLALLFGAISGFRRTLYRLNLFKQRRLRVPVVVVGNVVAGGSGKTPVVMALVRHLLARGMHVGVVSRGYGRDTLDCREVLINSPISVVGDEPALIKRSTSVPVFVARHRFDAASELLAKYPDTQIILCDDGLQHLSLHRDLEVCVFDDRGIGNGFLLPAGPLREPWPRPADLVLHTGSHPAFAGFTAVRALAPYAKDANGRQTSLAELTQLTGKPILALAAIAKPEEFFSMLRNKGVILAKTIALSDHHNFENWPDRQYAGYTLVCTEKDAVKLWSKVPNALAVPLQLHIEPAFFTKLDDLLLKIATQYA